MNTQPLSWTSEAGLKAGKDLPRPADLVLYFGDRHILDTQDRWYQDFRHKFPDAILLGCSSGGQITGNDVTDHQLDAVAVSFENTKVKAIQFDIDAMEHSRAFGRRMAEALRAPDLAGLLVLSDGLTVNGSELVAGMVETLGHSIPICGGLAGDASRFEKTLVGLNEKPRSGVIAAIGFYGTAVRIGSGNAGGWDVFGPNRVITKSKGNILLELDGSPALDLYERYLRPEDIKGLPGTALLYPLLIRPSDRHDHEIVRTVLAVNRENRSMTFAGDMPVGWSAQLMRSTFERLSDGAALAGKQIKTSSDSGLALLISCIGRRLMMGQRVIDEIEAANATLPPGFSKIGFYSYGEISPHAATGICELHNQTMTVMSIEELVS